MSDFNDAFFNFLDIVKPTCKCLIIGDFNIDLNKYDSNSHVERYVNDLGSMNFIPLSVLPTRCVDICYSCIDHVFSNFSLNDYNQSNIKSLTVTADISDHYANAILILSRNKGIDYKNRPLIRIFSSNRVTDFQSQLSQVDWSIVYNINSRDDSLECITNTLINLMNLHFPLVQCSRKNLKDKPWINAELKRLINIKNGLYFQSTKSKNEDDDRIYKAYRYNLDKKMP